MPHSKKSRVAVNTKLLRQAMRAARSSDKNHVAAQAVELSIRIKSSQMPQTKLARIKMRAKQI